MVEPDSQAFLQRLSAAPARRFVVAFSGGCDSTVLLDLCRRVVPRMAGGALRAVHVDHRIHPDSHRWARHCVAVAAELGVACEVLALADATAGPGGPEAAARAARYGALEDNLAAGEVLLTAHHLDDQLETVLLQLLRGAGVAGLAAMPAVTAFGAGWLLRPLLAWRRAQLGAYARRRSLMWLDDPANAEDRYDRSYLRRHVLPPLLARWPVAAASAARSARHCAAAAGLVDEVADADAAAADAGAGRLSVAGLRALSAPRRAGVLRHWLRAHALPAPTERQLLEALQALLDAPGDAAPLAAWPGVEVRRYRGRLYAMAPLPEPPALRWPLGRSQRLALPARLGVVALREAAGGLGVERLAALPLSVRLRRGGERLRPRAGGPRRELKTLLQEAEVVPWMRGRLPLLYAGDSLVAVAGLWRAAEFDAAPGEAALDFAWEQHPPLH